MAMAGEALCPQRRAFDMGVFFKANHAIIMVTPPIAGTVLDATGRQKTPHIIAIVLFICDVASTLSFRFFKSGWPMLTARHV
tara:strand:+ start:9807 stop:10052 length:246 start_codon:yes stop_codon:yes gene_type:complete